MNLDVYSTEQLKEEVARRAKIAKSKPVPIMVADGSDWEPLIKLCTDYVDTLAVNPNHEEDDHWFFEAAMEAVYGKQIWNWVNKIIV